MSPEDLTITAVYTIIGIALGAVITCFVAAWYYKKGSKDIQQVISLNLAQIRFIQDNNPKEGRIFMGDDGKYQIEWTRQIKEKISVSEDIGVVKNP